MATILAIEDEVNLQKFYVLCLEKAGHAVQLAATWEDGRARLAAGGVDLVILDIGLPDVDGIVALEELRRAHPHLPVVLITAYGTRDRVVRASRFGISDFIVKPPRAGLLRDRIARVLAGEAGNQVPAAQGKAAGAGSEARVPEPEGLERTRAVAGRDPISRPAAVASSANYELIRKIGQGGMAELFLAKKRGLEHFERMVAIKRLLPHLASDEDFVRMFLDECRIASQLHHPNIVQVFDLGRMGETFFLAMEYIRGRDLRDVIVTVCEQERRLPVGVCLAIGAEVAAGLAYAHAYCDPEGRYLAIVHRDVNPRNILLSYQGEVKITDFGIVKAAIRSRHTQTGVITGKVAYMSPEQARGERVDGRSDLFSLGIVLFEMLTGRRLFLRDNDLATLEAVRRVEVPRLGDLVAELPRAVEAAVMRCLAPDPGRRYGSGEEVQAALLEVMEATGNRANRSELGRFVCEVFPELKG